MNKGFQGYFPNFPFFPLYVQMNTYECIYIFVKNKDKCAPYNIHTYTRGKKEI